MGRAPALPPSPPKPLTPMDRHVIALGLMALCGQPGVSDEAAQNIRHAAEAVGVYDDKMATLLAL